MRFVLLSLVLLVGACADDVCPLSPSGGRCSKTGKICSYDSQWCICLDNGRYQCNPNDCPHEVCTGAVGGSCGGGGEYCNCGEVHCRCEGGTWLCGVRDMAAPLPRDLASSD